MESLYTVEVPLDADSRDPEADAYRTALNEVLVRMTGSTGVAESEEMLDLFPNPQAFVSQYQYGRDNATFIVTFEGEALERVLRQTSAPIWGSDRPLTIIWLAVDWGMGQREIIGSDERTVSPSANSSNRNRMLRERIETIATRRGLPIVFPLLDTEDRQRIGFSDIWGGFDEQLIAASERYGATSVLVGRFRPESRQSNRWTWYFAGQRLDRTGEPEDAVNMLADAMAANAAIPGNQRGDNMQLRISGINSVSAYGEVQRFLEKLRILDQLMINTVSADSIVYDIEARGGVDRLHTALRSSGFLVPVEQINSVARNFGSNSTDSGAPLSSYRDAEMLTYFYQQSDRQMEQRVPVQGTDQEFDPVTGPN